MFCTEKRREKINKPHSYKVSRLCSQVKSGSAAPSDPLPSSETDFDVNRYANLNSMQRLALGVYMYDRLSVVPQNDSTGSDPGPVQKSSSSSPGESSTTSTAEV